jgi:hypothetical protein
LNRNDSLTLAGYIRGDSRESNFPLGCNFLSSQGKGGEIFPEQITST